VSVEIARVGIRRVRVAALSPEVTEELIWNILSKYGDVKRVPDEIWSQVYRVRVKTGVRLVDIGLYKHILSNMKIEGHRALISYMGQPMTCYGCSEPGHQTSESPYKRKNGSRKTDHATSTRTNIVKRGLERVEDDNTGKNKKANVSHTSDVQQDDGLQSIDHEYESPKDNEPMVVGDLESSMPCGATPSFVNVNMNNEDSRIVEWLPKWYRNAVNDAEVEQDSEKPGKVKNRNKLTTMSRKKRRVMNKVQMQGIPKYPSLTVLNES